MIRNQLRVVKVKFCSLLVGLSVVHCLGDRFRSLGTMLVREYFLTVGGFEKVGNFGVLLVLVRELVDFRWELLSLSGWVEELRLDGLVELVMRVLE